MENYDNETKILLNMLIKKFGKNIVDNMISKKKNEYYHLIPEHSIIKILYFEKIKSETKIKIKDILPGIYFATVVGVVTHINKPVIIKKDDKEYTQYSFNIEDETGKTMVVCYDKSIIKNLILGSVVMIKKGLCKYSKIYINKKTRLDVLKEPKFVNIIDMKPNNKYYLKCTVASDPEDVPYKINNKTHMLLTFKIVDSTGNMIVTVWEKDVPSFKSGCRIRLENVSYYNNEIHVKNYSRIVVIYCPSDNEIVGEFSELNCEDGEVIGFLGNRKVIIPQDVFLRFIRISRLPQDLKLSVLLALMKRDLIGHTFTLEVKEDDGNIYVEKIKKI
ncbi:hypothetical protein J7J90_03965 [Candidatus Micrarchaeota archaeon]|nr:hypothetical protein [Candidatus Micrarchaeota archaeon]